MMVYYCLSKRTPLLNTHTFTPVESELNTLSAALAASKPRLAQRQARGAGAGVCLGITGCRLSCQSLTGKHHDFPGGCCRKLQTHRAVGCWESRCRPDLCSQLGSWSTCAPAPPPAPGTKTNQPYAFKTDLRHTFENLRLSVCFTEGIEPT